MLIFPFILVSVTSGFLYELSSIQEPADPYTVKGFTQFFTVAYDDDSTIIAKVKVNSKAIASPTEAQITGVEIPDGEVKVAYSDDTLPDPPLKGKLLFLKDEYKNTSVYQRKGSQYTVEAKTRYIVIFADSGTNTALKNIVTDENTAFTIYQGTPGDSKTVIYQFNAFTKTDTIFTPTDHFFIELTKGSLKFDVLDDDENRPDEYGVNGFIMSTNYPSAPSKEFADRSVKFAASPIDRNIYFQVSAGPNQPVDGAVQDPDTAPGAVISSSGVAFHVQTGSAFMSMLLPANTASFQISSTLGYTVSFYMIDLPTSPPTTQPSTTKPPTTKPPTTAGVSCPTVTCPVTPCTTVTCPQVTCPTVSACSCMTTTAEITTTDISTTTQSAALSTVTSVFTIIAVHLLV